MGVPRVPEAKAGPSQVQSWGPRAGSRREGRYLEHRPQELELSGFQAAAGCSTFRGHRSLEGWQAWPHSTVLCKHHFPRPEPWLMPGVGLFPEVSPYPRPLPPQLSLSHCLFPLLFFPFYPKVIRENFLCRVNAGKARVAQLYVGAQPPRPPGGVLAAALSMWPWGTCPLPAGSPAPTDFGVDVSF